MLIMLPRVFSRFIFTTGLNTNPANAMKRGHETVRPSNLELLVAEAGSAAALARLANTSESYLSQIRNQLTTPKAHPAVLATTWRRSSSAPYAEARPDVRDLHPLISWVQAGEWSEIAGNFALGDAEDLLPCPVWCSPETFVLMVRGESMEPKFHDGDLLRATTNG